MRLVSLFARQNVMRRVLISLVPIFVLSLYGYGLRILAVLAVVTVCGTIGEYVMLRLLHGTASFKIPEAIFVSCALYTLILPPNVPLWAAALGIVFGIVFGKGVFGGFGKNIFNPAMVGRCFVFLAFPGALTMRWFEPFRGFPGGFLRYSPGVDAITSATPLGAPGEFSFIQLLFGPVPGSAGEISSLLILAAAVYLVLTKTASLEIMLAGGGAFLTLSSLFYLTGAQGASPLASLFSGGILFALVFMATDPITAPTHKRAKILYGAVVGALAVTIRTFSNFREGAMFAVLMANSFAPLMDLKVKAFLQRRAAG